MAPRLPAFPAIKVQVVEDTTSRSRCDEGFVHVRRRRLRLVFPTGQPSEVFDYDEAWRSRLDAVIIAAYYRDSEGQTRVFLRSCLRPPAALREQAVWPSDEPAPPGQLWELAAGLVEQDERSPEGLRRCAAREALEELGLAVDPAALWPLGPSLYPAPGLIAERQFFFAVEVDPARRVTPTEDGSPLESHALVVEPTLDEALEMARQGMLHDMKTELGLRRLSDALRS